MTQTNLRPGRRRLLVVPIYRARLRGRKARTSGTPFSLASTIHPIVSKGARPLEPASFSFWPPDKARSGWPHLI